MFENEEIDDAVVDHMERSEQIFDRISGTVLHDLYPVCEEVGVRGNSCALLPISWVSY